MERKKRDTASIVLQTKKPLHQNNFITNNRLRTSTCQLKLEQLNKESLLGSGHQPGKSPKPRRVTKNQSQRKGKDSK